MAENSTSNNVFNLDDTTNMYNIGTPKITDEMTNDSLTGTIGFTANETSLNSESMNQAFMDLTTSALPTSTYDTANVGYSAEQATGVDFNVNNNMNVQNQLKGIIAAESPLAQQAQTRSNQQMNERGLLNSSMAVGAGQSALYDYALPIAQQDAKSEQDREMFKVEQANAIEMANVNARNRALEFGEALKQEGGLANLAALNRASEVDFTNTADIIKFLYGENVRMEMFNADKRQEANMYVADVANKFTLQQLEQSFESKIASADAQLKTQLQSIDAVTRETLSQTEADFKQLMQTTASAGDAFQETLNNINELTQNPDLDADALDAAIGQQLTNLQVSLTVFEALNPVIDGLSDLLDLSEYETTTA